MITRLGRPGALGADIRNTGACGAEHHELIATIEAGGQPGQELKSM